MLVDWGPVGTVHTYLARQKAKMNTGFIIYFTRLTFTLFPLHKSIVVCISDKSDLCICLLVLALMIGPQKLQYDCLVSHISSKAMWIGP